MKIKSDKHLVIAMVVAGLSLMSIGCTTRLVDFTVISTKNVDWSKATTYQRNGQRAEGLDRAHIIIFIPTGIPNMKESIDRAIESVPGGVALVDGVVSSKFFYIPYIYGQSSYVVEGSVLVDPSLANNEITEPYMIARMDKSGNLESLAGISQTDYETMKERIL
jgi:hypothetical protein